MKYISQKLIKFLTSPLLSRQQLSTPQKVEIKFAYILSSPNPTFMIILDMLLLFCRCIQFLTLLGYPKNI